MHVLYTTEALEQWLSENAGEPVILFKHSTTCPISAAAYQEVIQFEQANETPIALVRVIEERPLSNEIATRFDVRHQSPQALVIQDGTVTWHDSHYQITADSLHRAVSEGSASNG